VSDERAAMREKKRGGQVMSRETRGLRRA